MGCEYKDGSEYVQGVVLTRKIIVRLISKLEKAIDKGVEGDFSDEEWIRLWGEKESIVSVLNKLTTLLVKVVPIERQLTDSENCDKSTNNVGRIINSDDKEIIKRYIKKYKKN